MKLIRLNTLVIGSGAAGLCAALRLKMLGVESLAVYTEGLKMGTSINTGSDKQTYYKLGMYGGEADSPEAMAWDLAAGGSMHGDIALAEAALSPLAFAQLVQLGVPFPHDRFGQYIGYKTDHDPRRRATSCGPYTSREMCRALINAVRKAQIPAEEQQLAVKLFTDAPRTRVTGALFLHQRTGEWTAVQAENCVFATGGPGGLYESCVYPKVHTGGIGLALEAGAAARNLCESQFGLGAVKFRWNLSGSYMQVLPRIISTDAAGGDEREFLREYFASPAEMLDAVFLKGYQWPFAAGHLPGSSLIDVCCYIESVKRNRRIWLDYRRNPEGLDFSSLSEETRGYLEKSGAWADTPLERLELLNAPAAALFRQHGIDLGKEPLEAAVCAQHNNGGLAGNLWWESENLKHLFPIGEVNGSHGVTRPGGTALNAGQVGAFRAAEFIAARYRTDTVDSAEFQEQAEKAVAAIEGRRQRGGAPDWREERRLLQHRMSACGAFIREKRSAAEGLQESRRQLDRLRGAGLGGLSVPALGECLRNEQLLSAQQVYLSAIGVQIEKIGSRGGSLVLGAGGTAVSPVLPPEWRMQPENRWYRGQVMMSRMDEAGGIVHGFEPCRPVPVSTGWFETQWKEYREGKCYE